MAEANLHHAFTLCDPTVSFITDDAMVFRCGNAITFFSISRRHQSMLRFEEGVSLTCYSVSPEAKKVVACVHSTKPQIRIYNYPTLKLVESFCIESAFPIEMACVSADMTRLAAVTQCNRPMLSFWDLEKGTMLIERAVDRGVKNVDFSFDPNDNSCFTIVSEDFMQVWRYTERLEERSLDYNECVFEAIKKQRGSFIKKAKHEEQVILTEHLQDDAWSKPGPNIIDSDTSIHFLARLKAAEYPTLDFDAIPGPVSSMGPAQSMERTAAQCLGDTTATAFSNTRPFSRTWSRTMGSNMLDRTTDSLAMIGEMAPEARVLTPLVPQAASGAWGPDSQYVVGTTGGELLSIYYDKSEETLVEAFFDIDCEVAMSKGKDKGSRVNKLRASITSISFTTDQIVLGTREGKVLWMIPPPKVPFAEAYEATKRIAPIIMSKEVSQSTIACLAFTPSFKNFLAVDSMGSVQLTSALMMPEGDDTDISKLRVHSFFLVRFPITHCNGKNISFQLEVMGPKDLCAAAGSDGSLLVLNFKTKVILASETFDNPITALAASADGNMILLGFLDGSVRLLDCSTLGGPVHGPEHVLIPVFAQRIASDEPIKAVTFCPRSRMMAVLQSDNTLFFIGTRDLKIIGSTKTPPSVTCVDWLAIYNTERLVFGTSHGLMLSMTPPPHVAPKTAKIDINPAKLGLMAANLGLAPTGFCPDPSSDDHFFAVSIDKTLKRYKMGSESSVEDIKEYLADENGDAVKKVEMEALVKGLELPVEGLQFAEAQPAEDYGGHLKFPTCSATSADGQLLATGGADGMLVIRRVSDLMFSMKISCHDHSTGGVASVKFSSDSRFLITSGWDGGIMCWDVTALSPPKDVPEVLRKESWKPLEAVPPGAIALNHPTMVDDHVATVTATYKEAAQEVEELKGGLENLRVRLLAMLDENDVSPEIERLARTDFAVDVEQRDEMKERARQGAEDKREELIRANQRREATSKALRQTCWEEMEEKICSVDPFGTSSVDVVPVWNFGIRKEAAGERRRREQLCFLRKMSILECNWHTENPEATKTAEPDPFAGGKKPPKPITPAALGKATETKEAKEGEENTEASEPGVILSTGVVNPMHDAKWIMNSRAETTVPDIKALMKFGAGQVTELFPVATKAEKKANEEADHNAVRQRKMDLEKEGQIKEILNEAGRKASLLLFHSSSLVTNQRKRMQIHLLGMNIQRLKARFNKSFEAFRGLKENCTAQVEDKNKRLLQIMELLGEEEALFSYKKSDNEDPEQALLVDDSMVTAEKYLTPTEQKALQEAQEQEANAKDKWASQERALGDMMNGTLETKTEESELDRDVEPPAWLENEADPEDWTEEQKQEHKAFLAAVAELKAARAAHRQALQTEKKRLKADITELLKKFDEELNIFSYKRVFVQQRVCKAEYNMLALLNGLSESRQLKDILVLFKQGLADLTGQLSQAREDSALITGKCDKAHAEVTKAQAQEKQLEKTLKKEMQDFGLDKEQIEDMVKMFHDRGTRAQQEAEEAAKLAEEGAKEGAAEGHRDSLSNKLLQVMSPRDEVPDGPDTMHGILELSEAAVQEHDLPPECFDRLKALRRQKIEKEHNFLDLHKEEQYLLTIKERKARVLAMLEAASEKLSRHSDACNLTREKLMVDAEVLLSIHQGIVEVMEAPVVTDMQYALMMDRNLVKALNKEVRRMGEEKVVVLTDTMRFRHEMKALHWEKARLALTHQDAEDLTKELQLLRVTKNLQMLIKAGGHDSKQQHEMEQLEAKFAYVENWLESEMQTRKQRLAHLRVKIRAQGMENTRLEATTVKLEDIVRERVQVTNVQSDRQVASQIRERRMQQNSERSQLVRIADVQKGEISKLKHERDRLRNKTFPSFIQALTPNVGNVDEAYNRFLAPGPITTKALDISSPRGKRSPRMRARIGPNAARSPRSPRLPRAPGRLPSPRMGPSSSSPRGGPGVTSPRLARLGIA